MEVLADADLELTTPLPRSPMQWCAAVGVTVAIALGAGAGADAGADVCGTGETQLECGDADQEARHPVQADAPARAVPVSVASGQEDDDPSLHYSQHPHN